MCRACSGLGIISLDRGNEPEQHEGDYYTKTPLVKRLPTVGSLALALILSSVFGHALWSGLLIFLGTIVVCLLILRYVFQQPLDRLLAYKDFSDE
jgi:hypothetical protein